MEKERNDNAKEIGSDKSNLLRFILITSIGFAIGGIVAYFGKIIWGPYLYTITGLHYYFEFNYEYLDFIPFIVWGAVGGLGLGIAAKKDKKLHTLLGGLGFGIGFVFSVFFGAWESSSAVSGVAGALIGILEGISLSLYYRNSKSIGILAICGAAGFGAGGLFGIMTYKVTFGIVMSTISNELIQILIMNLTAFIVTGLIGGAALGYGIYHIKSHIHQEANYGEII